MNIQVTSTSSIVGIRHHKRLIITGGIFLLSLLLIATFLLATALNKQGHLESLIPTEIAAEITKFQPYFYKGHIPAGYTLQKEALHYDNGVFAATFSKDGDPDIILTQQILSPNFNLKAIEQNKDTITGTAQPAAINNVGGRIIAVMADRQRNVLIIATTNSKNHHADISALMRGLVPVD